MMPVPKSSRILLIFIASFAIGIIALPQTISLFAGQHYWYDLSDEGMEIPCEKCHADIAAEMESHIGPHSGETSKASAPDGGEHVSINFECWLCHSWYYTGYSLAEASDTEVVPGIDAHAASTVECIACHRGDVLTPGEYGDGWGIAHFGGPAYHPGSNGYCTVGGSCVESGCHDDPSDVVEWPPHGIDGVNDDDCITCHCSLRDPTKAGDPDYYLPYHVAPAGGFNLTYFPWDTGELEAHNAFLENSRNESTLRGENEACIACHSGIPVRINWTHAKSIEFDITLEDQIETEYGPHNWTITVWGPNGTANAVVWGNSTGYGTTAEEGVEFPGFPEGIYS